jgi:cytochrome c biogenesis protein CcmG/thiol:disulfide interchange protein DsbE
MSRVLILLPPLIFVALALLFFVGMQREDPNSLPSAFVGQPAPALLAEPLAEYPSFTSDVFTDGEVKLVNFWASWCAPCRVEHPTLMDLSEELPIYGVNQRDAVTDATAFLAELGNPFTGITRDAGGRQSVDWGVYGLPETFVLDGEGRVVLRFAGALTQRRLQDTVQPAIEAARRGELLSK